MQQRVKEWIQRYGSAEVISLITTLIPAMSVLHESGNRVAAAFAGTWGGNFGYFGSILARDMWSMYRALRVEGRRYNLAAFAKNLRLLLIEFGVTEVLDTFFVRPALMYYLPLWLHNFSAGIVVAKLLADVTFYLPAIFFYEWSKKRYRNF